jgi:hypothetical protein
MSANGFTTNNLAEAVRFYQPPLLRQTWIAMAADEALFS